MNERALSKRLQKLVELVKVPNERDGVHPYGMRMTAAGVSLLDSLASRARLFL